MINKKKILDDLIQVVFHRALASSVGVKDGTLTCTLGASQKFSWEQSVTYLAHFKKHCTTSLAEYWGGGGGEGGAR